MYPEYSFMFQYAFPCIKMHLADQGEPNLAKKGKCYGYGSDCWVLPRHPSGGWRSNIEVYFMVNDIEL